MDEQRGLYVQYGAGGCGPANWVNFDISPTLRAQRIPLLGKLFLNWGPQFPSTVQYGDIVRGLPVRPRSCAAVYCSHTLEHLALDDCRAALRHTWEYLVPGGCFRLVVPDLERAAKDYVNSDEDQAAFRFLEATSLGTARRPRGLRALMHAWLGSSAHLWMWDFRSLSAELRAAGFERIRPAVFGDSGDPMFDAVENRTRWEGCLGIVGYRPDNS